MPRRFLGWWTFAVGAASALTMPPADIEASDRRVDRIVRGSALARLAAWLAAFIGGAWLHSTCRRVLADSALVPTDRRARVRMAGVVMTIAFAVATVLQQFEPTPVGRFSWILPVAAAGASLVVVCAAGPIARALEDTSR